MPSLDLHQPLADRAHEAIRQAVLQAISDLQVNATGVGDAYFLVDLLFTLLDSALAQSAEQAAQITELTARVDALEAPTDPPPEV